MYIILWHSVPVYYRIELIYSIFMIVCLTIRILSVWSLLEVRQRCEKTYGQMNM